MACRLSLRNLEGFDISESVISMHEQTMKTFDILTMHADKRYEGHGIHIHPLVVCNHLYFGIYDPIAPTQTLLP